VHTYQIRKADSHNPARPLSIFILHQERFQNSGLHNHKLDSNVHVGSDPKSEQIYRLCAGKYTFKIDLTYPDCNGSGGSDKRFRA
jgi:hypothetical protein